MEPWGWFIGREKNRGEFLYEKRRRWFRREMKNHTDPLLIWTFALLLETLL